VLLTDIFDEHSMELTYLLWLSVCHVFIVWWCSASWHCWSMQRRCCFATTSSYTSRRIVPTKVSCP